MGRACRQLFFSGKSLKFNVKMLSEVLEKE
jgi:hypothetical protein